jgi:MFS family permease
MRSCAVQRGKESANYEALSNGLGGSFFLHLGQRFSRAHERFVLAPFIAPDLHLSHSQVGFLVSALALAWAGSGLIFGAVSDRIGTSNLNYFQDIPPPVLRWRAARFELATLCLEVG